MNIEQNTNLIVVSSWSLVALNETFLKPLAYPVRGFLYFHKSILKSKPNQACPQQTAQAGEYGSAKLLNADGTDALNGPDKTCLVCALPAPASYDLKNFFWCGLSFRGVVKSVMLVSKRVREVIRLACVGSY